MARSNCFTVAGVEYSSQGELKRECRRLLYAYDIEHEFSSVAETQLLSALFHSREAKLEELAATGARIVGWGYEPTTVGRCFAAILDNGERLHFSFPKSVAAIARREAALA